jgi:hypothetical protein
VRFRAPLRWKFGNTEILLPMHGAKDEQNEIVSDAKVIEPGLEVMKMCTRNQIDGFDEDLFRRLVKRLSKGKRFERFIKNKKYKEYVGEIVTL